MPDPLVTHTSPRARRPAPVRLSPVTATHPPPLPPPNQTIVDVLLCAAPGSPSVAMGVVMGLRMGGSLAGVVAARPREAARQLLRMGRDRVAVSMIVDL